MALDADALAAKLAARKLKTDDKAHGANGTPPTPAPERKPESRQPPASAGKRADKDTAPHSDEAEHGILGSMMVDPECITVVQRDIAPAFFYNPSSKTVFEALISQFHAGQPTDFITLTQVLRDRGMLEQVGGAAHLTHLFTFVPAATNIHYYIDILREKFLLREMISAGTGLARAAHGTGDVDITGILDGFSHRLERMKKAAGGPNGSELFTIAGLMAFDAKHDPNCLVGNRYLVRGGSSLWAGGSGYGKSSLIMQLAIYWACGRSWCHLRPVRPLKSLIIQAENDHGDMSEQLQGVVGGVEAIGDIDVQQSRDLIEANVGIHRVIGKTGSEFLNLLDNLCEIDRPDIAWIDPLFAFAGCDLMNAEKTGHFLRNGLFPIAAKRSVALNVVHHVGKPVRDPDSKKSVADMSESAFQYLGFGTSEIQNAFRAVNILVPVGNSGVFRLVLSKRGERAGAQDMDGACSRSIYLEHGKQGISWLQCEKPEKTGPGAAAKYTAEDLLGEMSAAVGMTTEETREHVKKEIGMSPRTFYRLWKDLKKDSKIKVDSDGRWVRKTLDLR